MHVYFLPSGIRSPIRERYNKCLDVSMILVKPRFFPSETDTSHSSIMILFFTVIEYSFPSSLEFILHKCTFNLMRSTPLSSIFRISVVSSTISAYSSHSSEGNDDFDVEGISSNSGDDGDEGNGDFEGECISSNSGDDSDGGNDDFEAEGNDDFEAESNSGDDGDEGNDVLKWKALLVSQVMTAMKAMMTLR